MTRTSKGERGKYDDDVLQTVVEIGDIFGVFPFDLGGYSEKVGE